MPFRSLNASEPGLTWLRIISRDTGEPILSEISKEDCLSATFPGLLEAIYSIIAIELTLSWNSVSCVYAVLNAGQLIPLISSITVIIQACYGALKSLAVSWSYLVAREDAQLVLMKSSLRGPTSTTGSSTTSTPTPTRSRKR
jgi:hypothetical protein